MLSDPVPTAPLGDAALHRRSAKLFDDWERPSAGRESSAMTIEFSRIQDTCQHRIRGFSGNAANFIVKWLHLRMRECPKNHPFRLSIVHNTNA
jgi:hypothetical protein